MQQVYTVRSVTQAPIPAPARLRKAANRAEVSRQVPLLRHEWRQSFSPHFSHVERSKLALGRSNSL